MNDTIKTILERQSVRSYTDQPVKHEDLELIIKCAQYAPTGMGKQPWHFTVIENKEILDKISEKNKAILLHMPDGPMRDAALAPDFDSFRGAPAAIIVSGENLNEITLADCANASENIALAAWSLGLGSCYLASFKLCMLVHDGKEMLDELGIPEGYTPLYAVSIGYAKEIPSGRAPRREGTVNYVK